AGLSSQRGSAGGLRGAPAAAAGPPRGPQLPALSAQLPRRLQPRGPGGGAPGLWEGGGGRTSPGGGARLRAGPGAGPAVADRLPFPRPAQPFGGVFPGAAAGPSRPLPIRGDPLPRPLLLRRDVGEAARADRDLAPVRGP